MQGHVLHLWTTKPGLCSLSWGQAHVAAAVLLLKSCWHLMVGTPWGIRIPPAVSPSPSAQGSAVFTPCLWQGASPAPLPATTGVERWWWYITKGALHIPGAASAPPAAASCHQHLFLIFGPPLCLSHPPTDTVLGGHSHQPCLCPKISLPLPQPRFHLEVYPLLQWA